MINQNGLVTIFECIESEAPTFIVDKSVNFITFDAQNIPLRASKTGALLYFDVKDHIVIERFYLRFPDNFRLWDDNLVITLSYYDENDVLVEIISNPDTPEIFVPLSDELIPLNLFKLFPDDSKFIANTPVKIKILVDVVVSKLSMVNVPDVLDEAELHFYIGAVIRHTIPLVV